MAIMNVTTLMDDAQVGVEAGAGLEVLPNLYAALNALDEEAPDVALVSRALDIFLSIVEREWETPPEWVVLLQAEVRAPGRVVSGYLFLSFLWAVKMVLDDTGRSVDDLYAPGEQLETPDKEPGDALVSLQSKLDATEDPRKRVLLHMMRGLLYTNRGDHQAAVGEYEQAYILAPQDPAIAAKLAHSYMQVGEREKGRSLARKALLLAPGEMDKAALADIANAG